MARVGDICESANGRAFKPTEWDTEGAPIIRIQNLKNDNAPFNYFRGEIEPRFRVQRGDLLFAWSGTPGTSFGAHIWRGGDAVLNQHIFNLQFDRTKIDERFFCYALNRNVADYVAKAQGGVGLAHITKGKFEDSFVPLPDIAEQRAVVAEIEKQFSRLDEAVAGLKRVKANLKRYMAAILRAAVEGRLVPTEADLARREGRNYETGTQLLQRILDTRRSQWQGKGKYKEPAAPDTTNLPELPEGWTWATYAQIPNPPGGMVHDYVPFYFAPRSPMLGAIDQGQVPGCQWGQGDIVHLETTVDRAIAGNAQFVFYDRNATLAFAQAYSDLARLDAVAWELLTEEPRLDGFCKWWHNRHAVERYADRMERRQAEFLVRDRVALARFVRIGVMDGNRAANVRAILDAAGVNLPVEVKTDWYFLGQ